MNHERLRAFVKESNMIEGIHRDPTDAELQATTAFVQLDMPTLVDLEALVSVYQPGAELRIHPNMNVRVGTHTPPSGGIHIRDRLCDLLDRIEFDNPWQTHVEFETLHPFMDGNGRAGRAIWLWQMVTNTGQIPRLSFLHTFYYQTLQNSEGRS